MTQKDLSLLHVEFMQQCRFAARLRPATLRSYEATFRLFAELAPSLRLAALTPETVVSFFRTLEERIRIVGRGKVRRGVKPSTIASYRAKLHAFFAWLVAHGHLDANPRDNVPAPTVEYEDRKYLSRMQVERIFVTLSFGIPWSSALIRKRNIALFSVLLNCGLRKGELLGLRLLDLDLDREELTVRAETSKSRRRRTIPLNSTVLAALKDYLQERARERRLTPALWTSGDRDREFTADGLKHVVEQVKSASGTGFHLHQFRHTFAVNLLVSGVDVAKLRQLLGHKDVRMTCTYLRVLPAAALRPDVESLRIDTLV